MTRFILIRHGFSVANQDRFFAGASDVPLAELGRKQGEIVSRYVAEHYAIDAIYSSPLSRARDTVAELAERTGLPVLLDEGLREIYGGTWETLAFAEIAKKYPDDFGDWEHRFGLCRPTGGESYAEVRDRMMKTMEKIARPNDGKTVAVASHALAIRAFHAGMFDLPLEQVDHTPELPNASVSEVVYEDGRWAAAFFGKADFLGEFVTKLPPNI